MALNEITRRRLRVIAPLLATAVVIGPLGFLFASSLVPPRYSITDMGYPDYGGGPIIAGHTHGGPGGLGAKSIADLVVDPARPADVRVDLVAEQRNLTIAGRTVPGYTLNGRSPGPTIDAVEGQLVEVHLRNASVAGGITLHWHGLDVPNAMDGVAGVTQDAVGVGSEFTYRFLADQVGTFWYHSHQVADAQVAGGLLGALVVRPKTPLLQPVDVVALAHTYGVSKTLNGRAEDVRVTARPGQLVRVRVINTDNGSIQLWASGRYKVLAVDGHDLNAPGEVANDALALTAGGRADLEVTVPTDGSGVRVQISKATAVIVGSTSGTGTVAVPAPPQPPTELDLLHYGAPAPLGFDPQRADRHFEYSIGRRPGFVRGKPGLWWSINGHLYPHVPMFMVREGDVVVMHIDNHSGEVHPMHLHGHHAVVLARDGVPATGSPWWVDSLGVADRESYDIAFVADNPGIWMDHCHNLQHAAQGMVAHLMYEGYQTPYLIGGDPKNRPE